MPTQGENTPDPLDEGADPRLYQTLATSEGVLAELAQAVRAGTSPVLLAGPSGLGKTLILFALSEREQRDGRCVRLSRGFRIEPAHVTAWLLVRFFGKEIANGADADALWRAELRAHQGEPVLLLVDDVDHALRDSLRRLGELARESDAFALVAAGTNGAALDASAACLEPRAVVRLPDTLPDGELAVLFDAIAVHPDLPPEQARALERLDRRAVLREAGGNPLRLKRALARRLEGVDLEDPAPIVERARPRSPRSRSRATLGVVAAAALAALLLVFWRGDARETGAPAALPPVAARPRPAPPPAVRLPDPIAVQVNAKPWARVSVDGRDVGTTPFSLSLAPGPHTFHAEFPDGKRIERRITIGPDERFVTLR